MIYCYLLKKLDAYIKKKLGLNYAEYAGTNINTHFFKRAGFSWRDEIIICSLAFIMSIRYRWITGWLLYSNRLPQKIIARLTNSRCGWALRLLIDYERQEISVLTENFTILEPQNMSIDVHYVAQKRRWADFEAVKLWNVKTGFNCTLNAIAKIRAHAHT